MQRNKIELVVKKMVTNYHIVDPAETLTEAFALIIGQLNNSSLALYLLSRYIKKIMNNF